MKQKNVKALRLYTHTHTTSLRKEKGITLIALVITIIVLLILAGVTIVALSGDNGILQRASEASERTKQANVEEQVKLAVTGSIGEDGKIDIGKLNEELEKIEGEKTEIPVSSLPADITIDGYEVHIDGKGIVSIGDNTGETVVDGVTVPDGFYYVGGTKDTGLVISDAEGDDLDNSNKGNQFVWVPVENFEVFKREHFGTEAQKWWTGTFVTDGLSENNLYEPEADGIMENTEVEKMYKSVKENKGFYVGRYEAGTTASSEAGIRGEVVSKKMAKVYNNIGFADTDDMTDETGGAVEVARSMYSKEKGDSVTSTLIYGVQWDAIMRWMKDEPNLTDGKYIQDSTGMGWYDDNYASGNSTHQTGTDLDGGKNKVKNIYDLAGNVWEWTIESSNTDNRVGRGGGYLSSSSAFPASGRGNNVLPSMSYSNIGFRVTLYL